MTLTTASSKDDAKWIDHLVGAICDPVLCWPGYETDRPPDFMMHAIKLTRLLENMAASHEGRDPMATDAECSWYLSTASLANVPSEKWTRIYMYCFNQTMHFLHKEVPDGLRQETLSQYDMAELKHLKIWIYEKRCQHRKEKARAALGEKREVKKEKEEKVVLQPSMFDF